MKWNVREWSIRYIPSEIIASISAVLSATFIYSITKNSVLTAIAGTWGENLGYYGSIFIRDILITKKKTYHTKVIHYAKVIRNLILEFGLAEILDSFLVRPFTMYLFPLIINNLPIGILLGKLVADIIFYIPTIFSYELRKKYLK